MRRPLLLIHDPTFGGMGHGARFLLAACADAGLDIDTLQLTTPGRSEDVQGRLGRGSAQHALTLYARFVSQLVTRRPRLVYLPIAQWGLPLARDLALVATATMLRSPVVVHLHGSQLVEKVSAPRTLGDRCARLILRGHRWAVLSEALRQRLLNSGAATDVHVLRNPAYPAAPDVSVAADGALRVGFLGLCSTQKGLDILCDAVTRAGRSVRLVVAGPIGDYQPPSEPWLDYLGKLDREELESSFWPEVDVLALPARWQEGQPFVVLEALERGKGVIVTESLGLRELIDAGAVVVIAADAAALAPALAGTTVDNVARQQDGWRRVRPAFDPERLRRDWLYGLGFQEEPTPSAGATPDGNGADSSLSDR